MSPPSASHLEPASSTSSVHPSQYTLPLADLQSPYLPRGTASIARRHSPQATNSPDMVGRRPYLEEDEKSFCEIESFCCKEEVLNRACLLLLSICLLPIFLSIYLAMSSKLVFIISIVVHFSLIYLVNMTCIISFISFNFVFFLFSLLLSLFFA